MNIWQQITEGVSLIIQYIYVATDSINYPSYGIAIILFTILVKLVLFPLTRMQIRSMSAMQEIQPKMKEIQDRYKDIHPRHYNCPKLPDIIDINTHKKGENYKIPPFTNSLLFYIFILKHLSAYSE